MSAEKLLDAIGLIRDEFVAEPRGKKAKRWKPWQKALAAAAVFILMLVNPVYVMDRLEYFRMGCSAWAGSIVEGSYYYTVAHDGLYRYIPGGESEKVLSTF